MKNKIIILFLTLCLFLSMTNFSLGLTQPEQPVIDESNPVASNELIEDYNKKVDDYNIEVDKHNNQVDTDYEEAHEKYEEEKTQVEANNEFVDKVEEKVTADSSEARGFENNSTNKMPTDWSDKTDENTLKTIQVEKSETPANKTIKVINIHVFLDENANVEINYDDLTPTFYNLLEDTTFELSENLTSHAVLTEWETAEIDYDDTVTLSSESQQFAGNIVWVNGKRQWFGAAPMPYFFRSIEGYTQGYWMSGGSMFSSTATKTEYGWSAGETYSARYAEKTISSYYLYNGQLMSEDVIVRTTDRQEPKNIFSLFTYIFTRLAQEPEKQELPTEPTRGDYLNKLEHLSLLPLPISPLEEPNDIDENNTPAPIQTTKAITTNNTNSFAPVAAEVPVPPETIIDEPTPLVEPTGNWALINLITTILSCICAVVLLFVRKNKKEDEPNNEEKKDMRGMIGTKLASILIAIASIIIFIFSEDTTLLMVYTDKWTILMILLLIVEIINIFIIRQQSKGEEEND